MPRWDLDEKTAKHWADKEAGGASLAPAVLLGAAVICVLAVVAAAVI